MRPFLPRFLAECVLAQGGNSVGDLAQADLTRLKQLGPTRSGEIRDRASASVRTRPLKSKCVALAQHLRQIAGATAPRDRPSAARIRPLPLGRRAGLSPSLYATVNVATHYIPHKNQ